MEGWVAVMVGRVIAVGMGLGIVVVVGLGMKELHLSTPHLILGYKGIQIINSTDSLTHLVQV